MVSHSLQQGCSPCLRLHRRFLLLLLNRCPFHLHEQLSTQFLQVAHPICRNVRLHHLSSSPSLQKYPCSALLDFYTVQHKIRTHSAWEKKAIENTCNYLQLPKLTLKRVSTIVFFLLPNFCFLPYWRFAVLAAASRCSFSRLMRLSDLTWVFRTAIIDLT